MKHTILVLVSALSLGACSSNAPSANGGLAGAVERQIEASSQASLRRDTDNHLCSAAQSTADLGYRTSTETDIEGLMIAVRQSSARDVVNAATPQERKIQLLNWCLQSGHWRQPQFASAD